MICGYVIVLFRQEGERMILFRRLMGDRKHLWTLDPTQAKLYHSREAAEKIVPALKEGYEEKMAGNIHVAEVSLEILDP